MLENMISKILEMDKKARDMQAKAEENKVRSQAEIAQRKEELYEHYAESLKEIMEMTHAEQQEALETGRKKLDETTWTILSAMNDRYQENGEAWADQITNAVICNA